MNLKKVINFLLCFLKYKQSKYLSYWKSKQSNQTVDVHLMKLSTHIINLLTHNLKDSALFLLFLHLHVYLRDLKSKKVAKPC